MEGYQKESIIGRGAYGTVFLCSNIKTKKEYILKEIPMETVNEDERALALNEVQILKVLNHPNIVLYIDSALESQALLIVMEYVNGGNLHDFLMNQTELLAEDKVLNYFTQLIVALNHIHSKNVLHRDLKTQNLLIDRHHSVIKISDFGISKVLSSKSKAMSVVGTPCYISPEVCEHSPYNQKSDIWAVGCILYELMTLKRAFEARNLPALVTKIMRADYQPPSPKYSSQLRQVMSRCLNLEPHRRPTTAQLLCDPIIHKKMLLTYADIGAYKPSFKFTKQVNNFPTPNLTREGQLSGLSGQESKVFLWGDGHISPIELPGADGFISKISIGGGTRAGLTNQNTLVIWECVISPDGLPDYKSRRLSDSKFKSISAGLGFIAAITQKGVLVIAKAPNFEIEIVESLLGLDCHTCAASDKTLYVLSMEGEIWKVFEDIQSQSVKQFRPMTMPLPRPVKPTSIYTGIDALAALTEDGCCFVAGKNTENRLLLENKTESSNLVELKLNFRVKNLAIGPCNSGFITSKGKLFVIGTNKYGALGDSFSASRTLVERNLEKSVVDIAVGPHYTCAVCSDGSVWSWGRATRGQLGRSPDPQDSPRQITITGNAFTVDTNDGISLLTARKSS